MSRLSLAFSSCSRSRICRRLNSSSFFKSRTSFCDIFKPRNLTRMKWLLILAAAAAAHTFDASLPSFEITKSEVVSLNYGTKIVLKHTTDPDEENSWVLGRFLSEKCYPEEGKLGDRFKNFDYPGKPWVQFWSMVCNNAAPGSDVRLEFWYMKPQDAELYFNDYQAYVAQAGSHPQIKFLTLHINELKEL
mmetsp:Transcript_25521/g.44487  ORF Transcript_25521/g.44487 Transcript_25521/m.44487 type:complete len:190 (-) Transcript_25521:2415-2984(-)